MHDPTEVERPGSAPRRSSGLTFVALLVGAVLVAVLLGQLAGSDARRVPLTGVTPTRAPDLVSGPDPTDVLNLASGPDFADAPDLATTPQLRSRAASGSPARCRSDVGGLALGSHLRVPAWALERWDCEAPGGPWSVIIRGPGGRFGVNSAVVTFPVDRAKVGSPASRPPGGVWNAGAQLLVWPLAGLHAQIVGDLGQARLADLAMSIRIERGEPHLAASNGFATAATIPYRPTVVHEMRYGTADLGQRSELGDGLLYTGVLQGASFESQVLEARAEPAGLVRGRPAVYAEAKGRNGTLAWEPAPGEVAYIGFSGPPAPAGSIEVLRALADQGRALTPAQWQTKDRIPVGRSPG
ncbi:MAG: hypothetical protein ABI903_09415 [Actinomycetota bacterium]